MTSASAVWFHLVGDRLVRSDSPVPVDGGRRGDRPQHEDAPPAPTTSEADHGRRVRSTPSPGWWNGRHDGLKIHCPKGRAGSNPAPGTHFWMMTIYTVGHGTRTTEELVAVLRGAGVGRLIDVRRHPGSKRHPHLGEG